MNDMPRCPKCGAEMVLKTARKGKFRGKQFYSCSNYPSCKGIIDINDAAGIGNKNTSNANVNNFFNDNYTDIDLPVFLQAREKFPNYQIRFY
ncbi:MAG: topoisomerase DNA-binding C4 zinc finger domain-containing protein [Candidatus Tenebribacter mawsonii]|nr:topoisomerase DNA-binding C4 zinc finger domain-containing protein [Candidatus Tenebribacter mawsonii]